MKSPGGGLWTVWTTRKKTRVTHTAHSPYYYSDLLSRSGPVFGDQMVLFSRITVLSEKPKWPCFR